MKDLNAMPLTAMSLDDTTKPTMQLNKDHLLKYLILFTTVTLSTLVIPTCGVLKSQAVAVGLLASTVFAILDMMFPNKVYINGFHH